MEWANNDKDLFETTQNVAMILFRFPLDFPSFLFILWPSLYLYRWVEQNVTYVNRSLLCRAGHFFITYPCFVIFFFFFLHFQGGCNESIMITGHILSFPQKLK